MHVDVAAGAGAQCPSPEARGSGQPGRVRQVDDRQGQVMRTDDKSGSGHLERGGLKALQEGQTESFWHLGRQGPHDPGMPPERGEPDREERRTTDGDIRSSA